LYRKQEEYTVVVGDESVTIRQLVSLNAVTVKKTEQAVEHKLVKLKRRSMIGKRFAKNILLNVFASCEHV